MGGHRSKRVLDEHQIAITVRAPEVQPNRMSPGEKEYYDVERADVNGGVSDFTNQESEVKSCFSHWLPSLCQWIKKMINEEGEVDRKEQLKSWSKFAWGAMVLTFGGSMTIVGARAAYSLAKKDTNGLKTSETCMEVAFVCSFALFILTDIFKFRRLTTAHVNAMKLLILSLLVAAVFSLLRSH